MARTVEFACYRCPADTAISKAVIPLAVMSTMPIQNMPATLRHSTVNSAAIPLLIWRTSS